MPNERYNTKQKACIEALLMSTRGHMTAEEICRALEEDGTPVGLTTVYRTLERLCEAGSVRRYVSGDRGKACFQYVGGETCEHFHLKCVKCDTLFHADCEFLQNLSEHVEKEHGFHIDHSQTVFYGLCASCLRSGKKADGNMPLPNIDKGEGEGK